MHRRNGKRTGTLLGVPYDLNPPTLERVRRRLWNPEDDRVLVPEVFGWGWTINWHALLRRIGTFRGDGTRSDGS